MVLEGTFKYGEGRRMMEESIDYYHQCRRLYKHCDRIFEKSGRTRFTTIRKAAKTLRMLQSEVLGMAEDLNEQGFIIINVACGILGVGCSGDYPTADWELEPTDVEFDL